MELEYERSVEETREAVEFFPYFLSMLSTLAASRDIYILYISYKRKLCLSFINVLKPMTIWKRENLQKL